MSMQSLSPIDRAADSCRCISSLALAADTIHSGDALAQKDVMEAVVRDINATIELLAAMAADWIAEASEGVYSAMSM
jgi:hypothetical protein